MSAHTLQKWFREMADGNFWNCQRLNNVKCLNTNNNYGNYGDNDASDGGDKHWIIIVVCF